MRFLKHIFSITALFAAVLMSAWVLSGCHENSIVDARISPTGNSTIGVYDTTLPCITHTYFDDTAITSMYISSLPVIQGVGAIEDPYFGSLVGATHFQLLPVNASISVYDGKTIDSAVLVLPYAGVVYGDTADQTLTQSYQAFFLQDQVPHNTVIYSYTTRAVDENNPLSDPYDVNLYHIADSVTVNDVKYAPCLRIPLKLPVLLSRLLPALTDASNNPTDVNAAFHNVFKGVCIRPTDSRKLTTAFPYFQLDGSTDYTGAGILVYYHTTGQTDTLQQRYFFDGTVCGFFNSMKRNYSRYPVNNLYNSHEDNDSIIAMQNQPGASLDILIPGISHLPSGAIAKATLQLTVLPWHDDSRFLPLTRLYPSRVSNGTYPAGADAGSVNVVMDRYPTSSLSAFAILDGTKHDYTQDGTAVQTYTIGLPREVMTSRTANNDTLHLRINGTQDYTGAYRVILGGGSHPNPIYRAKLFVVYSSLN